MCGELEVRNLQIRNNVLPYKRLSLFFVDSSELK